MQESAFYPPSSWSCEDGRSESRLWMWHFGTTCRWAVAAGLRSWNTTSRSLCIHTGGRTGARMVRQTEQAWQGLAAARLRQRRRHRPCHQTASPQCHVPRVFLHTPGTPLCAAPEVRPQFGRRRRPPQCGLPPLALLQGHHDDLDCWQQRVAGLDAARAENSSRPSCCAAEIEPLVPVG